MAFAQRGRGDVELHHGPVGTAQWDRHRGGLSGCTAAAVVFPLPCLSRVPGGASALALDGKRRELKFEQSLMILRILVPSFKIPMGDFVWLLRSAENINSETGAWVQNAGCCTKSNF